METCTCRVTRYLLGTHYPTGAANPSLKQAGVYIHPKIHDLVGPHSPPRGSRTSPSQVKKLRLTGGKILEILSGVQLPTPGVSLRPASLAILRALGKPRDAGGLPGFKEQ